MTRDEKIWRIQTYRPYLYSRLEKVVPNLIRKPEEASVEDIRIYNNIISEEAYNDNNPVFRNRFSF